MSHHESEIIYDQFSLTVSPLFQIGYWSDASTKYRFGAMTKEVIRNFQSETADQLMIHGSPIPQYGAALVRFAYKANLIDYIHQK